MCGRRFFAAATIPSALSSKLERMIRYLHGEQGDQCTADFGKDCLEECSLSVDICSSICAGRCIQKDFDAEPYQGSGDDYPPYQQFPPHPYNQSSDYEDEVRTVPLNRFSDVDGTTLEGQTANALANDNVIGGFPDGTFGGGKPVNRAETAKFIVKALLGEVPDRLNNGRFLDAIEGEWYVKYIITAAEYGYLNGYPDGTFGPEKTVNRAELSEMLVNAFNLPKDLPHTYTDVVAGSWYGRNAGAVQLYDLFPGGSPGKFMPGQDVTRGGVAISIYKLLEKL